MKEASYQLKFLESTENLKAILSRNSHRSIPHRLCNNIMACLEQGRSFLEIAELSPLEIKPLIVFYGMIGLARAIVMARTLKNFETLPRKHGLQDISPNGAVLDSLTLKVTANGTFDVMNDAVRNLEKFIIHTGSVVDYVRRPTARSQELHNVAFTLKDILARIDGLQEHYFSTFSEGAKVLTCSHFSGGIVDSHQSLSFDVFADGTFKSKEELFKVVSNLRARFSFLTNWSFFYASHVGGFTSIEFRNGRCAGEDPVDSSDVMEAVKNADSYGCQVQHNGEPVFDDDILSKTAPVYGGLHTGGDTHLIEPIGGLFLPEFALFYMGMFLLSSLVRYRPDIWSNVLSRRAVSNNPVGDKALSLIEHFIEIALSNFPQLTVAIIREPF
jgi:hypothetical protein